MPESGPLFSFLSPRRRQVPPPPSTGGRLAYAVGDVHGRLDALQPLLVSLAKDAAESAPGEKPLLIFLGDYVDRGPDTRGVLDRLLDRRLADAFEVHALKGNHEHALLRFLTDPGFGPILDGVRRRSDPYVLWRHAPVRQRRVRPVGERPPPVR